MFYGSIKFKRTWWFGKLKWYAKFKMGNDIIWIKVKPKEIKRLLDQYGSRYMATEYIIKSHIEHNYCVFNVNVMPSGNIFFKHENHGLSLPLDLYDSVTFKIICKK